MIEKRRKIMLSPFLAFIAGKKGIGVFWEED
jgi:hypothetical protein